MHRDYKTSLEDISIDQDIIWDILRNKLLALAMQIKRILDSLDSPPQDTSGR